MRKNLANLLIMVCFSMLVCFQLAGCGPGKAAEDIEIIDSGLSSNEEGDYTYAIVFENHSDKVIKMAIFDVDAYDENGEKLKPLDQWYSVVRTDNVRPGERGACTLMMKHKEREENGDGTMAFSGVPADVQFKLSSETSFKDPETEDVDLRIVDYELVSDDSLLHNANLYDGDSIVFRVRVANEGEEDFYYDLQGEEMDTFLCCHVVYKDKDGKVIGGASDLYMADTPGENHTALSVKAGEEAECYFEGPYCFWPSDSQELYLEAYKY